MRWGWAVGWLVAVAAVLLGLPLRVAADSTVTIGNDGPFAVTVSPGTIVDVELSGQMSLGQPHPYAVPDSSNPAVLAPISGSTDAQARTHATYRAVAPGSATLSGSVPSGIMCPTDYTTPGPGCVGVAAVLFRVAVTVTDGTGTTITGPQVGGAPGAGSPAAQEPGGRGSSGWIVVGASAIGGSSLASVAVLIRRRRAA